MASPKDAAPTSHLESNTEPWPQDLLDFGIQTMRLSHRGSSRRFFRLILRFVQQVLAADKTLTVQPSIATQHTVALLIQRITEISWKGLAVDDMVKLYYHLSDTRRNDWSVMAVARWAEQILQLGASKWPPVETPVERAKYNDAEEPFPVLQRKTLASLQKQLQVIVNTSYLAANSFFAFWTVWDAVASSYVVTQASEGTPTMTLRVPGMFVPFLPGKAPDANEADRSYDILCTLWKFAVYVHSLLESLKLQTGKTYHPLLPTTTAFVFLISLGFLYRVEESPDNSTESSSSTAVSVEDASFLDWLVSTLQDVGPIPGQAPDAEPITKATLMESVSSLAAAMAKEANLLPANTISRLPSFFTTNLKKPAWVDELKVLKKMMPVTSYQLYLHVDSIITLECNRIGVLNPRCVCDITRMMSDYLNSGHNPAVVMRSNTDYDPVNPTFPTRDTSTIVTNYTGPTMEIATNVAPSPSTTVTATVPPGELAGGSKATRNGPDISLHPKDLAKAMELAITEARRMEESTRSVTPPALSEVAELTEWATSLFSLKEVRPSEKLLEYLAKAPETAEDDKIVWTDVILTLLNRTLLRLAQEGLQEKQPRSAPVTVATEKADVPGLVHIHGDATPDKQLARALVAFYYHALEAVLFVETARLKIMSHPQIVLFPTFHRALLACCMWCVTKAVGVTQKLRASPSLQAIQIHTTLHVCETNPYEFLKVSDSFLRALSQDTARGHLGSPLIFALPRSLQQDLRQVETNVSDTLLWVNTVKMQGSLPSQIDDFIEKTQAGDVTLWPTEILAPNLPKEKQESFNQKEYLFPTPDHEDYAEYRCVNFVIRKVLKLAYFRLEALCQHLGVSDKCPVATQAWVAFRYIVRYRPFVFYDRHVDHWILCCLYGVAKALKYAPELTFKRIIEAYVVVRGPEVGDVTCQHIVRHIKIAEDSNDPNKIDNIIALYNRRFVPTMKEYLLQSRSIEEATETVAKTVADVENAETTDGSKAQET